MLVKVVVAQTINRGSLGQQSSLPGSEERWKQVAFRGSTCRGFSGTLAAEGPAFRLERCWEQDGGPGAPCLGTVSFTLYVPEKGSDHHVVTCLQELFRIMELRLQKKDLRSLIR